MTSSQEANVRSGLQQSLFTKAIHDSIHDFLRQAHGRRRILVPNSLCGGDEPFYLGGEDPSAMMETSWWNGGP